MNQHTIQSQKYGVELEVVGITRKKAAHAVQKVVGGTVKHVAYPHCYDPFHVTASDGRVWKIMADASLSDVDFEYRVELVTPILEYSDMKTFQEVVRALRKAGARASRQGSIHVHVEPSPIRRSPFAISSRPSTGWSTCSTRRSASKRAASASTAAQTPRTS